MKIKTQRLVIRPLEINDWQAMQEILTDFENSDTFMYDYKAPTDTDAIRSLIPFWVKSKKYYAVIVIETGEIAGFLSMTGDELGFTMKTSCKRKGYGYEASMALLQYMCKKRGMNCFTAQAALENTASLKLLEKLGFRLESIIDIQFRKDMPAVESGNFVLDL